jgi:hypothetical protein
MLNDSIERKKMNIIEVLHNGMGHGAWSKELIYAKTITRVKIKNNIKISK